MTAHLGISMTVDIKQQFLPEITIYRNRPAGGVDTYQLLYDPAPLRGE